MESGTKEVTTLACLRAGLTRRPETGAVFAALSIFVFFAIWAENFLTAKSMASTLTLTAELAIIAMAVTLLMIAGEFDLSVGSVLGISSVLVPYSIVNYGLPPELAILVALGVAALIGLLHGLIVVRVGIPSFIVTLGGLLFWRGMVAVITEGFPLSLPDSGGIFDFFGHRFSSGLNVSVFWFLVVGVVLSVLLTRTRWGNWIFASGGNERAARGMGVPVDRVRVALFMLTAGAAGLVGVIQIARFNVVDPARGTSLELEAIAAAVIGGARLTGGYGSVIGTALGCLMLGMIRNGLVLGGVAGYWYTTIIGALIVVAVLINQLAGRTKDPRK